MLNTGRMLKTAGSFLLLAAASVQLSGCVVLAAAGAGVLAHDEATENDGEFDPLEKVEDALDDDDGK